MKIKVKTIDIEAKEWFDKINGNSYFSAVVTVNYGMKTEKTFYIPMSYGYDSAYCQRSLELLKNEGLIKDTSLNYFKENKIILRRNIKQNCLKRELLK